MFVIKFFDGVQCMNAVLSVSVCYLQLSWLNRLRYALKFGGGMCLDNIPDEFKGQGHKSKFKVIHLGNVIVLTYSDLSDLQLPGLWCDVMTPCDVTA